MTTRQLERSEWQEYFDGVAKRLPAAQVRVSVLGKELGAQPETESSMLIGISYDPYDQCLSVTTPNLSHRVMTPQRIAVQETAGALEAVEVIDQEGNQQIIQLERLKPLPSP